MKDSMTSLVTSVVPGRGNIQGLRLSWILFINVLMIISSWIKQNEKTAPLRPVVTKFLCKGEKKRIWRPAFEKQKEHSNYETGKNSCFAKNFPAIFKGMGSALKLWQMVGLPTVTYYATSIERVMTGGWRGGFVITNACFSCRRLQFDS